LHKAVNSVVVRSLFITTESPKANPNMMRFTLDKEVLPKIYGAQWQIAQSDPEMIAVFPLASNIFKVSGGSAIKNVFLRRKDLNVTKESEYSWADLEPAVRNAIHDYYSQRNPVFELDPPPYVPLEDDDANDIAEGIRKNVTHAEQIRRGIGEGDDSD